MRPFGWRFLIVMMIVSILGNGTWGTPVQTGGDGPVRATLQAFFKSLRDKNVEALYRYLPSRQQHQVRREDMVRFVSQVSPYVTFQRGQVAEVQLLGNFAVVDTVLFVQMRNPLKKPNDRQPEVVDAKIVMQQYLVREDHDWKLATGDLKSRADFIASIPEFRTGFTLHTDRFYVLHNSKWEEVTRIPLKN